MPAATVPSTSAATTTSTATTPTSALSSSKTQAPELEPDPAATSITPEIGRAHV